MLGSEVVHASAPAMEKLGLGEEWLITSLSVVDRQVRCVANNSRALGIP